MRTSRTIVAAVLLLAAAGVGASGCGPGGVEQNNVATAADIRSLGPLPKKPKKLRIDKPKLSQKQVLLPQRAFSAH